MLPVHLTMSARVYFIESSSRFAIVGRQRRLWDLYCMSSTRKRKKKIAFVLAALFLFGASKVVFEFTINFHQAVAQRPF